jgi:hypothetical protein
LGGREVGRDEGKEQGGRELIRMKGRDTGKGFM